MLASILAIVGCTFLLWMMVRTIRSNPGAFSKANINQSLSTLGILALILIVVIGFAVILLRAQ